MRIAQVAPLAESVPPKLYGGTERVVASLTEELLGLGCQVTLFASGDSSTSATLVPICPKAIRLTRPAIDPGLVCALQLEAVAEMIGEFDVVHFHSDWMHLPLFSRLKIPFLTTMHGRLDLPLFGSLPPRFTRAPCISISDNQRSARPELNWIGTIYHGLPEKALSPCFRPEGYLAFLGRIVPEKGPHVAIRVACAAGLPIRMAAKIPRANARFFRDEIKPLMDGKQVDFIGEVSDAHKASFLGNAAALLFPIDWPEPFGLVMIEAMACGTPVIAWRCGSVSEIVDHGESGFIVETEEEAVAAIARLPELDRRRVRAVFERRFTARRMAEDYLRCFAEIIETAAATPGSGEGEVRASLDARRPAV